MQNTIYYNIYYDKKAQQFVKQLSTKKLADNLKNRYKLTATVNMHGILITNNSKEEETIIKIDNYKEI